MRKVASAHEMRHFAISPDGRTVLASGNDREVKAFDVNTAAERGRLEFDIGKVNVLRMSPDGLTAVLGGSAGRLVIWDVE